MQNKNQSSALVGVLKTTAFFAVIIVIVFGAIFYFGARRSNSEKSQTDGYQNLDISDLADFDYYTPFPGEKPDEKRLAKNQIPEKIKNLNGQKVSLTGFMMPVRVDDNGNVEEFALNGNYDMCFYGAPSQINQWIHVRMQPGTKAKFSHNPTVVSGTLEVGELVEDGQVISLYRLTGDKAATANQRGLF
ncbi:MAG: DUF3299 domain-containing protein [Pyrinomonadaceae bacterium]|nr:DUF3299 domain-containing protein [Pyrinomonadaceae bacterium]